MLWITSSLPASKRIHIPLSGRLAIPEDICIDPLVNGVFFNATMTTSIAKITASLSPILTLPFQMRKKF
jgi:hypothetical protein